MKRGETSSGGYERVKQALEDAGGVVVRQNTQGLEMVAEAFDVPFEQSNTYSVHRLPTGKTVKGTPSDPEGWSPSGDELRALEPFLVASEESSCCIRLLFKWMGCGPLRPLKMHFAVAGDGGDVYIIDRPFRCSGVFCSPLEMRLDSMENGKTEPVHIGRVRENFSPYFGKCCSACCLATGYTDIERVSPSGDFEKRYTIRVNRACCGRVNNCFAPSCCRPDAVYDILDPEGEVAAHMQVSFGRGELCTALCRAGGAFNNFVLEFPKGSTVHDRALLLAAIFQIDYQFFEKK